MRRRRGRVYRGVQETRLTRGGGGGCEYDCCTVLESDQSHPTAHQKSTVRVFLLYVRMADSPAPTTKVSINSGFSEGRKTFP